MDNSALCFGRRLADFLDQRRLDGAVIFRRYPIGETIKMFLDAFPEKTLLGGGSPRRSP
jgi:hypothetical protein